MVKAMHAAGIEVILDVVYNHTAEGNHLGPDAELQGHRQRGVLPPRRGRPANYYMDYTGTGNSLNVRPPALAAADHGLAALLGHRDARRRLPLRPRLRAGARVLRRRPARDLLRARAAGPGGQPGQADRRAVGRRPRRLPGRQLPAAVDRVERQVPRHRPRLLARRARRWASSPPGSPAPPTSTSTPDGARSRASTSSPPTTASRCATSSPTTRSTTRPTARTTTTARATTGPGTTASRARPTTPRSSALRARAQRNFLATLLLSQGVPMILHGDELGRTQDGNNNTYAQDSEISWVHWEQRRPAAGRVHRRRGRAARRPPDVPPQAVLHRQHRAHRRRPGERLNDIVWLHPDGGRWRTATGPPRAPRPSGCTSTATASPGWTPRGNPIVDDHFLLYFNAGADERRGDAAARGVRRARGTS